MKENIIFFTDIAAELTKRGQFKLFFLEIDGVNVAACICFDYEGKFLLYNRFFAGITQWIYSVSPVLQGPDEERGILLN